jgi:DNA-binding transcriptional regulator YdaS (Cro superfamily)
MNQPDPIELAASKVGGIVKLSLALGLSRSAVSQWARVPAERVLDVERLTGVPREILRADLYPVQRTYTRPPQGDRAA